MVAEARSGAAEVWTMAHLGTPMAIRVAATLHIADYLAAGIRMAPEIAETVGADADALRRLMKYLAVRGFLVEEGDSGFALTELGETLRDDHPAGMRAMLDIEGAVGRLELSFIQLLHSVRTGEAAYPQQFGRPFWDDLAADPTLAASFDTWMSANIPQRAPDIVACYDWGSLGHVVDVGGGDGSLLIALLHAFPNLHGTVVDQPETAETARKALTAAGLAHRGEVVAGSFFDPLPPGAGAYLLSFIVHDWNDAAVRRILRRCAEAAGADGSVFVVENTGLDGESPSTGMDLRMLAHCGGKERGVAELAELASDCGLRVAAVHPSGQLSTIHLVAA